MTKKLRSVLLIDDDEATNYIHKKIIEENNFADQVIIAQSGEEALQLLNDKIVDLYPPLDLIFLDINMPGMDGWEFLEHYKKLSVNKQAKAVLIMLTTSLNPNDRLNASKIDEISGFENKPLNDHKLSSILDNYFSESI